MTKDETRHDDASTDPGDEDPDSLAGDPVPAQVTMPKAEAAHAIMAGRRTR